MSVDDWNFEADLLSLPELKLEDAPSIGDALIKRLAGLEETHALAQRLEGGAIAIEALAAELFPLAGEEAVQALIGLISVEAMAPREKGTNPPMGGRNLLVFSDNRQDAAFFAPFFERTSREQAVRSAILRALNGGKMDIDNLVGAVLRELRADGLRLYRPGVVPELETGSNELLRLKALIIAELTVFGRGRLTRISR